MKIIDPLLARLDGVSGEPALSAARLDPDWIRQRFVTPPQWQPEQTDEQLYANPARPPRPAAVLIGLVRRDSGLQVLLTRRTAHLSQHAGQISFPGGASEPGDRDAVATALRESEEEIGLQPGRVNVIGQMPVYRTVTGFAVTPVVAWIEPGTGDWLRPDPNEVAEIFEVPLQFLMDGGAHQIRSLSVSGPDHVLVRRSFYAMPYQDYFIWGATAAMLRNLFHFLRA